MVSRQGVSWHPCNARGVCWEGFLRSTCLGTGWVSLGTCSGSLSLMNNIPWVTSRRNPCLKKWCPSCILRVGLWYIIGSHSTNRCNCTFESTVVNISRILYNRAPWFCGTPFLLWWLALRHAWHCRQVFVASRALIREGYETRTKCWSTLFAHMAGFAMISTLLKIEPTRANPRTRSKDLWWIYELWNYVHFFFEIGGVRISE